MIILNLPFPPSVNTYYRRGRHATYLSVKGRQYKEQVADIVAAEGLRIEGRLSIWLKLTAPTKRKYDIDNRIKATLDALQDAGVFEDDEQVDAIHVIRRPSSNVGGCVVIIASAAP